MTGGLEPSHCSFPLTGRLKRIIETVVEVPMSTVFHARYQLLLGCFVAPKFIRNHHTWDVVMATSASGTLFGQLKVASHGATTSLNCCAVLALLSALSKKTAGLGRQQVSLRG